MSRRQREGKYAGRAFGRHLRSRGVNCIPGRVDAAIELHMRQYRSLAPVFDAMIAHFFKGQP